MTKTKGAIIASITLGTLVLIGIATPDDHAPDVRVEPAARRDLVAVVIGNGHLQPKQKLDVSADIAGRIVELNVREGSIVKKGDVLLRLDASRFQIAATRAEASLEQTLATAEQIHANLQQALIGRRRAEEIDKSSGLLARLELEQARTQATAAEAQYKGASFAIAQARAALADAREQLAKTTIVAPMGGLVTRLNVRAGELGGGPPGSPDAILLTIADLSAMEARIIVDETDLPHVHLGDSVTLRLDAFPRARFTGRVSRIASSALRAGSAQQSNNFPVIVTLDGTDARLRPDFSTTAEIVTELRRQALSVPILSLVVRDRQGRRITGGSGQQGAGPSQSGAGRSRQGAGIEGVFVVENGIARFRPVRIGIIGEQHAELLQGIRPGEIVVSGPFQLIRDLESGAEVISAGQP